jgi:hypothetical protein
MTVMGTLAFTFQGPFVFSIEAHRVKVYAPICLDHHAAIFTVDDQSPICGRARNGGGHVYTLVAPGIKKHTGPINYPVGNRPKDYILDAAPQSKINPSFAKFCLQLPVPDSIYGINLADTEVVKGNKPTNNLAKWSTGLRFYYSCDLKRGISLQTPELTSIPLSPCNLGSFTAYADIDVRHVGPDADDAEHNDAISCFDQTMKLAGLPWWLSYGQAAYKTDARTGADCNSPSVVLGRGKKSSRSRKR